MSFTVTALRGSRIRVSMLAIALLFLGGLAVTASADTTASLTFGFGGGSLYTPGIPVSVTLDAVQFDTGNHVHVEDQFPAGWTVSDINFSGSVVSGKVVWDQALGFNEHRSFSYKITAPAGTSITAWFYGNATFSSDSIQQVAPPVNRPLLPATTQCTLSCVGNANPSSGVAPLPVTFSGSGTPAGCSGTVSYDLDFGDGSAHATSPAATHTYTNPGAYPWKLTVSTPGATNCVQQGTIQVSSCALDCNASVNTSYGAAPLAVVFSGSASATGCTGSASYDWDFGDNSGHSSAASPTHSYVLPGTYTWTVTVSQGGQTCQRTGTITVVTCAVTCTATASVSSGRPPLDVSFQASANASGCSGSPTYVWSFGDTTTSTSQNTSHTYTAAGEFDWSMTATVGTGNCLQNGHVSVAESPHVDASWNYVYLISNSAHVGGLAGTNWVSDVVLHNPGGSGASVFLFFLEKGLDNTGALGYPVGVAAGHSVKLADIVTATFGRTGTSGAVLIGSDQQLVVTSRTYNNAASGTFGQFIAGYPAQRAVVTGEEVRLIELSHSTSTTTGFRTNIGFANATGSTLQVDVSLYSSNGSSSQLLGVVPVTVPPYGYLQKDKIFASVTSGNVDDGFAVIKASSANARYFSYASVIDNRTGDPVSIVPVSRAVAGATAGAAASSSGSADGAGSAGEIAAADQWAGDSGSAQGVASGVPWMAGDNTSGQLGYYSPGFMQARPVTVPGVSNVAMVAAGYGHTLVMRSDRSVLAWGGNSLSQLGDQTNTHRAYPVTPFGPPSLRTVTAHWFRNAGVSSSGKVDYWGGNPDIRIPAEFVSSPLVDQVSSSFHYLVHTIDNQLWAWGDTSYGQVGWKNYGCAPGDPSAIISPQLIQYNIKSVAAGTQHSLSLNLSGTVTAWGRNHVGQLGDGTTTQRCSPTVVGGLGSIRAITAGDHFSLAIADNNDLYAWGYNGFGQLGDGTNVNRPSPVRVLDRVVAVAAGSNHVVAIRDDSSVWTWGWNARGQLGDGTTADHWTPQQVPGLVGAKDAAAGNSHTVVRMADGTLRVFGSDQFGQLAQNRELMVPVPYQVQAYSDVVQVGAGGNFTVVRRSDGSLASWGANRNGQLGDGTTQDRPTPTALTTIADVTGLSVGSGIDETQAGSYGFVLAVTRDGALWTWGDNSVGELGLGSSASRYTRPTKVAGMSGISSAAGGFDHSLALDVSGIVWSAGSNNFGQLGNSAGTPRTAFGVVAGLGSMVQVATGNKLSVARGGDGSVYTWGNNLFGQLGQGSTASVNPTPKKASLPVAASEVACGNSHCLARTANGLVYGWGRNDMYQLGLETDNSNHNAPVQIPSLTHVVAIAAAGEQSYALKDDGTAWGWGANQVGSLGYGDYVIHPKPDRIATFTDVMAIFAGPYTSALLRPAPTCALACRAVASPTTGSAPLTVGFSASSASCAASPAYTWDFGDSSSARGASINKTYQNAGSYTWVLTVQAAGSSPCTQTGTISVTSGCGTPSSPSMVSPGYVTSGVSYPLSWAGATSDSFRVEEATDAAFTHPTVVAQGSVLSVSLRHDVTAATTYFYRAKATRVCGGSTYVSDYSATVAVGVMPPPAALAVYVPSSAHVGGVAGTNWRTDLEVHNPTTSPLSFNLSMLTKDQDNSAPPTGTFSLAGNTSRRFTDVLNTSPFLLSGSATMRLTPSAGSAMVTSRTYNDQPGGTYGQFIAGVPETQGVPFLQPARLVQMAQAVDTSQGFRSNLGLVNLTAGAISVDVSLFKGDGTALGPLPTTSLPPYGYKQIDKVFTKLTSTAVHDGYAVVTSPSVGARFLAYASVIDNRSGDPIYIPAQVPSQGDSGREELLVTLGDGTTMALVRIPAGTFTMGSPTTERGRTDNEDLHQVTITHDFFIGKTEVTQAQWRAVMGALPEQPCGLGDDHPVCNVSWSDIAGSDGFISRLGAYLQNTGGQGSDLFRLPTDAEWEYAARAGTQTRFFFGDNLECDATDKCGVCAPANQYLWWCGNTPDNLAQAVADRQPNAFGLYDTVGNLWEWVADWYQAKLGSASVTDPTGPAAQIGTDGRVVRGGRWASNLSNTRSAVRFQYDADVRKNLIGFRIARSM